MKMIPWKRLAKYLAGEAGEEDKRKLDQWINKDYTHSKSFEETKMYWNHIKREEASSIDVEGAWDNLKTKILEHEPHLAQTSRVQPLYTRVLKYAALVLLVIGLGTGGFFAYRNINQAMTTVTVQTPDQANKKQVYLPDGSLAYVHYGSMLNYPKQFEQPRRSVKVKGEVYFDVERNPAQPFIVSARDARIEVLGTSFNVNTNFSGKKVEVLVKSGSVKLSRENLPGQYLILEAGYKGILTPQSLKKTKNTDSNYIAWVTGRLTFKGQRLEEVVKTLMRTYNVNIRMEDPGIGDSKITTNFTNESIDTVLAVIATTFDLKVEQTGSNTYLLKQVDE